MWMGNEIYHYNMALAVARAADAHVSVSTRNSPRMSSRFAKTVATVTQASAPLPSGLIMLKVDEFVSMIDDTSPAREAFRLAVLQHLQGGAPEALNSKLKNYASAIGESYRKNVDQRTLTLGSAGASLLPAMLAAGYFSSGGPLAAAVAGIVTFLSSPIPPHFVVGWDADKIARQLAQTSSETPRTGTFLLDLEKAEKALRAEA